MIIWCYVHIINLWHLSRLVFLLSSNPLLEWVILAWLCPCLGNACCSNNKQKAVRSWLHQRLITIANRFRLCTCRFPCFIFIFSGFLTKANTWCPTSRACDTNSWPKGSVAPNIPIFILTAIYNNSTGLYNVGWLYLFIIYRWGAPIHMYYIIYCHGSKYSVTSYIWYAIGVFLIQHMVYYALMKSQNGSVKGMLW